MIRSGSENVTLAFGMPWDEQLFVIQPGPFADCEHDRSRYSSAAPMLEVEHLAGQIQQMRDARDVGRPEYDEDIPSKLREVQHVVANGNRNFHMRHRLGFAAVALEQNDQIGNFVHVSELAVRQEVVTGGLKLPRSERKGSYRPQHLGVVAAMLHPMVDAAPMTYHKVVVSSPDPSGAGIRTMDELGFDSWSNGQFQGNIRTVYDRIRTVGVRQRAHYGLWGWKTPGRQ